MSFKSSPSPYFWEIFVVVQLFLFSLYLSLFLLFSFSIWLFFLSPQKHSQSHPKRPSQPYNLEILSNPHFFFFFHFMHTTLFDFSVWNLASLLNNKSALHPIRFACMLIITYVYQQYVKIYGNCNEEEGRTSFSIESTFPLCHVNPSLKR